MDEHTQNNVDVRGLAWYLALAYWIAWLMWTGLWLSGQGVTGPWFLPVTAVSMFAPAIAAFVVTRWISPVPDVVRATGLRLGAAGTRWLLYYLFAFAVTPLLVM